MSHPEQDPKVHPTADSTVDSTPKSPDTSRQEPIREIDPEVVSWVQGAVAAAIDLKAEELRVLDLAQVSDITDYFVICTGTNQRQVAAIADTIVERLRAEGVRPLHVEGLPRGEWVLVDYGAVVIHVFQPESRAFFGLERLWSDAPDETSSFASAPAES